MLLNEALLQQVVVPLQSGPRSKADIVPTIHDVDELPLMVVVARTRAAGNGPSPRTQRLAGRRKCRASCVPQRVAVQVRSANIQTL